MSRANHFVARPLTIFVTLFIISHHSLAAPTQNSGSSECPILCRPGQVSSVLNYEPGEYAYEYESETTTTLSDLPDSKPTKVNAKVVVTAYSSCDFTLRIQKSTIKTSSGQEEPLGLEGSPIRFTLEDGIIGTVCVTKDESIYAANIKRSILSLLQNKAALNGVSENDVVESDVSGRCPTRYTLSGDNYVKTKALNACLNREGGSTLSHGVAYDVVSGRNSVPEVVATQNCEQSLENGVVKSVKCTEVHESGSLQPISETVGVRTRITVTLNLVTAKKGTNKRAIPSDLVKSSIYFDYVDNSPDATRQASAEKLARDSLDKICEHIRPDGASTEVPILLLNLKKSFSDLTQETALGIYNELSNGQICSAQSQKLKKLYVDTAAISGTDASIAVLAPLYQAQELDAVTKRYFFLKTTFASAPTEKSLKSIVGLINTKEVSKRLLLAASGLAYRYCKITNNKCGDVPEYVALIDKIAEVAKDSCLTKSSEEGKAENAVAALQALGNLQVLTNEGVNAISSCLGSFFNRIKVPALQAFRRDPCQTELKKKAQEIFANRKESSNVRMISFVANLRCLEPSDAGIIQNVLNDEESLQVGSFVQSLLQNLVKNSSPSTRQLKSAAQKLSVSLKYPTELRKFSRNLQSSFFNAAANLGYSAEGNVMFSKESFIPRQLSANLTIDVLGQSYNLLEVGLYLENFDHLQESLFGPQGKFPFSKQLTFSPKSVLNTIFKQGRSKRDVTPVSLNREGVEALHSKVDLGNIDRGQKPAIGDLYIRVLGTTIGVVSVNTNRGPETLSNLKEKVERFVKGTLESSSRDVDVIKSIQFLNIDIRTPTVAGFALAMSAQGSTVPSIEYKREGKRPDGAGSPLALSLKIETNVATGLKLRQSVLAGPFESGLQYEAKLKSGGGIDLSLHRDSKKFEAKLNLPHETIRSFEVTSNIYWIRTSPSRPEQKTDFRPSLQVMGVEECLDHPLSALLGIVGVKVCVTSNVNLDVTKDKAALFGKQYFAIKLQKTEPSIQGYSVVVDKDLDGDDKKVTLTLDTPGSTTNRKVTLNVHSVENRDAGTRKIELEVDTPLKGGDAKFTYERTNSDDLKSIKARLALSNLAVLSVHGQVKKSVEGANEIYEPSLTLEYPDKKDKTTSLEFLKGRIVRTKSANDKSVTFDLSHQFPDKLATITPLDIFLKGAIQVHREGQDFKYEIKNVELGARDRDQKGDPNPILALKGHAQRKGQNYESDLDVKYGLTLEHHLTIHKTAFRNPGVEAKLETKVTSSRVFFLNFDLKADIKRDKSQGAYNSVYSLTYGPSDRPRWELSTKTDILVQSLKNFEAQHEVKFFFPVRNDPEETYNVALKSHVKHVQDQETLLDVQFLSGDEGSKGKVKVYFHKDATKNNDFDLHLLVNCKDRNVFLELTHKRSTVSNPPEGWTSSFRHETELTAKLPSGAIPKNKVTTVVNLLNTQTGKGISINADVAALNIVFDLKMKAIPEKYLAKISLKEGANEIALLTANVGRTSPAPIQIKSILKNVWSITLTREPKSDSHVITKLDANIEKTGRQVLLDVSRQCEGDVHKVKVDFKWDAKRDPSQSVQVESVTKITYGSILVDSKNVLTILGQRVELNLNGKLPTQLKQGEHSAAVTFVGVDGRSYKVEFKNELNSRPEERTSDARLDINVPELKSTSIVWKIKSLNSNLPQAVFDITADVGILTDGVQNNRIEAQIKSAQTENSRRSLQVKVDLICEAFGQVNLDSKQIIGPKFLSTSNSLQVGGVQYGIEAEGESNTGADGTRTKNMKYTLTNIRLPSALKAQKIEGKVTEKCQFNSFESFQIEKQHELKLDDQPTFNYKYDISLRDGKLLVDAAAESNKNNVLKVKLHGTVNTQLFDVSGSVGVSQTTVFVKSTVDRMNPLKNFELKAETTNTGFGLKLGNSQTNSETYALTNIVKYKGKTAKLEGELTVAGQEKALSIVYSGDLGYSNIALKIRSANGVLNYNLDFSNPKLSAPLKIGGDLVANGGAYGGNVNVEYGWKATGKAVLEINDNRRKLVIKAGRAEDVTNVLTLEYTKAAAGVKLTYEGTFSTDIATALIQAEQPIKGTFKAESVRSADKGFELKSVIQFSQLPVAIFTEGSSGTIEIEIRNNNMEVGAKILASNQPEGQPRGKFISLESQLQITQKSPLGYAIKLIRRSNFNAENVEQAYGIVSETTYSPKQSLEHKTTLLLGDDKTNTLAIRLHGKGDGEHNCEGGIELTILKRTINLLVAKTGPTKPTAHISVWLDKTANPNQKLSLNIEHEKLTTDDGAKGYAYKATISHPSLVKDLVITRKVVRFGRLTYLDSTTELDVFENPNNKIVLVAKLTYDANSQGERSNLLKTKFSVQSEGLGIFVEGDGDISKTQDSTNQVLDSYLVNLRYSFKNRNGELKSRNIEIILSENLQSLLIGDRSKPEFLISRNVRNLGEHRRRRSTRNDNALDVRYEVHLPGMKDTRVVDVHLHGANLPHLSLNTFNTDTTNKRSYELAFGFPTERELILSLKRSLESGSKDVTKNILAEFGLALNTSQLLSIKLRWDLKTIQEVLTRASERFENTGDGVQATSEAYISELSQDIQQTLSKLSDTLPNLRPLREHIRTELQEIKQEWEENPETKSISDNVKVILSALKTAVEPLKNILSSVCQLPEYLKELSTKSPELVKKYEKALKSVKIALGHVIRISLKTLRPIAIQLKELLDKISARIGTNFNAQTAQNALKKAQTIADGFWAKAVDVLLSRADDLNRYVEQSAASQEIKDLVLSIIQFTVQAFKGDVGDVNARVEDIFNKGRVVVKKVLAEVLTVDLQNGVISALIPLPKPVNSFLDVKTAIVNAWPSRRVIPYRNQLATTWGIFKQLVRDLATTDTLTAITRALRTNASPHSGIGQKAYIIGSQYFQTFDGDVYHYEGVCQYLLTGDFLNRDLTVAVDFNNDGGVIQKSIIVADRTVTVVINPDFSVSRQGDGAHINVQESAEIVKVTLEDELTVECNKALDVCVFNLENGYRFGRVAGLLGTYNNEQDEVVGHDAEAFAATWKLDLSCVENPIPNHAPVSKEAKSLCSATFSSRWSSLRYCFKRSDPLEYQQICENLSRETGWNTQKAVATSKYAYEQTCN